MKAIIAAITILAILAYVLYKRRAARLSREGYLAAQVLADKQSGTYARNHDRRVREANASTITSPSILPRK